MPALSVQPRTWRPLGPRIAAAVFSAVLVGAFAYLWLSFDQETKEEVNLVQRITVVVMVGVGVALLHALARSKVVARDSGLVLVNGYRRREYEWAEIIAIRMPPGAPWPTLDLADGTTVSVLGIHGSDGRRATEAVRELKGLLDPG
ncbi:PH domain-containing protein [Nocardioides panacisoli]|uniref:PH domain-containing protein n=1 Tax=Nocardioides panacisoli TaxID=627624 RepID=UPI001C639506|nr:PH domain-containing protein [Nocardioides panacisoli]QYJ05170.1 PH domain-containing protein [Nocardioides panacisoli]